MLYANVSDLLADKKNQKLINSFLKDYKKDSYNYNKLRNDAEQALWDANLKYDPQNVKGASFTTFAYIYVSAFINNTLYKDNATIRIPSKERAKVKHIDLALNNLKAQIGYMPCDEEIMEKLNISKTELNNYKAAKCASSVISIDMPLTDEEGNETTVGALLPDSNAISPFDTPEEKNAEKKMLIKKAMSVLNERERVIVTKIFGLDGKGKRKLEVIAREENLTAARCCQIKSESLKKMRMKLCA